MRKDEREREVKEVAVGGVLLSGHKGSAVEVPFDPAQQWGLQAVPLWPGRRGYPVWAVLNRVQFRSAIVSRRRRFFVLVDESVARRARVAVGDQVQLTVKPAEVSELPGLAQLRTTKPSKGG